VLHLASAELEYCCSPATNFSHILNSKIVLYTVQEYIGFVRGEQKGSGAAALEQTFVNPCGLKIKYANCLQLGKAGVMIPVVPSDPAV